jgi:hypothetical protein
MSTLPLRDSSVILNDHTNWIKWLRQIETRADSLRVWEKMDPNLTIQPLTEPEVPPMPQPSEYQASQQAINAHAAAQQAINAYGDIAPFIPARPADLATNAKASYKEDLEIYKLEMDRYKAEDQKYTREQAAFDKITQEIQRTVNNHLYTNCCRARQSHRQWITNLMATVGVDARDEIKEARERYRNAMKAPRMIASWETWLTEVDHATTEGKAIGIPECQLDTYIKEDFTRATAKHSEQWTISFAANGLKNPLITVKDMIREYRDHMQLFHPSKAKTTKAAFGAAAGSPTLHEDGSDNPGQKRKSRRGQKQTTGATGSNPIQQTTSKCEACDMRHALKDCWYAHPGNAPTWWRPQEDRMDQVQSRIDNSLSMQETIRSAKRPARSKTPLMKKSHTATPTVEQDD